MAKQQVAETEFKANIILDEQRHALIERASYEFRRREEQAESAVQNLKTQLRQQDVELYGKSKDYDKSKQEQYLLRAEHQSRERTHRDALNYMRDELEELRRTRHSWADLREEAYQDAISQEGKNILDQWIAGESIWTMKCGRSQSTVAKLTQEMRELQER